MTIIGLHVAAGGLGAHVWADTETFTYEGTPAGHVPKLAVNPLAIAAGTGAGWDAVAAAGCHLVQTVCRFDDLPSRMPDVLRRAARRVAPSFRDASFAGNVFVAAGLSHAMGRLVGYVFDALTYFEPRPISTACWPEVEELGWLHPQEPVDVVDVAELQMRALQARLPKAGAGLLTVATLSTQGLSAGPIFDLGRGEPIRQLQEVPALESG